VSASRPRIAFFGVKYLPSRGGVSRVVEDLLIRLRDRYDLTVYCESHEHAATAVAGIEFAPWRYVTLDLAGYFGTVKTFEDIDLSPVGGGAVSDGRTYGVQLGIKWYPHP